MKSKATLPGTEEMRKMNVAQCVSLPVDRSADTASAEATVRTTVPAPSGEETVRRYAQTLRAYAQEMNRLAKELRQRDATLVTLRDEVGALREERAGITTRLAALERTCTTLARHMRAIETAAPRRTTAASTTDQQGLFRSVTPASKPASAWTRERLTLIHVESRAVLRTAVESVTSRWSCQYSGPDSPVEAAAPGRRIVVLNLLGTSDPLEVAVNTTRFGIERPAALVYCADESHGVVLGMVEFFSPARFKEAAERVRSHGARPRHVLIVGSTFESVQPLHAALSETYCAISTAFDAPRTLQLVPTVKPDLVLIDLNLTHGDALRLACRLRSAAARARTPIGFFWTQPIDPDRLRASARLAIRDAPFTPEDLARAISRLLDPAVA